MFRKLKLQFILTNISIIAVLFVLLTAGSYIMLQIKMINHAEFFTRRLAMGINAGMIPEFPRPGRGMEPPPLHRGDPRRLDHHPLFPGPPMPPNGKDRFEPIVFFVKLNPAGAISGHSFNRPAEKIPLGRLAEKAKQSGKESGIVVNRGSHYFFYKTTLRKEPGTLIVFQDLKLEIQAQRTLVFTLVLTGIVFLVLSMLGSLFMANRAIGPIQLAWQQQKDFLADASHELRTPLMIIQTNLEVMAGNPTETVANQMSWLSNAREEVDQMVDLVSSLLFLARVDSRQNIMEVSEFSLDQTAVRAAEVFTPLAAEKQVRIDVKAPGPFMFFGDESNIRKVLEILLDNAIRHTPEGGHIAIELRKVDRKILLTVADDGEGIPSEQREKIFDRFYQADASRSKGGAGLGLSIAKCIVENHGGSIQVASKPGMGTAFTIQLPVS